MNRCYQLLPLLLLSGCELSLSLDGKTSCSADRDCLGDRICVENTCIDPDGDGEGDGVDPGEGQPDGGHSPIDAGAQPVPTELRDGSVDAQVDPLCSVDCALGDSCSVDANCKHGTCEDGLCVTVAPSILDGDTVFRAENSPYWLASHLQIGGELLIEPGVRVIGKGHDIRVFGRLEVRGTAEHRVRLEDVRIVPSSDIDKPSPIEIEFAYIKGGNLWDVRLGPVYGSLRLVDSIVDANELFYLHYPVSDSLIARNVFMNGAGALSVGLGDGVQVDVVNNYFDVALPPYQEVTSRAVITLWASYAASSLIARHNTFANPELTAVALAYEANSLHAEENYWSTSTLGTIQRVIYDRNDDLSLGATIPYEPYLTAPHPLTPTPSTPAHAWPEPELAADGGVQTGAGE